MCAGYIEARVALPETFARLRLRPCRDSVKQVVPVPSIAYIHLPVPEEVVLGILVSEVLHWHKNAAIRSVQMNISEAMSVHTRVD